MLDPRGGTPAVMSNDLKRQRERAMSHRGVRTGRSMEYRSRRSRIRESAENFASDFWAYVETLDGLSEDVFAQFLKDEEFSALNGQL